MSAAIIERKFHIAAAKSRRSQQQSVRLRPGLLIFIIGWIQMLPVLSARPTFRLPTIFGGVLNDSNNNDENNNTRHLDGPLPFRQQQQQSPFPANAGPPPPPRQPDANNTLQQPQYPYLTPPQYPQRPFTTDQQQQQQQQPFVPTYPSMHAPTLNNNMNHQQQQYQQQLYSDSRYPTLQHQLHVAVCRERELAAHAHNLSRAYAHLQTSYDACACDLTLATKRALHAETVAATRANQLLEALDNGTRLAALITTLNETCAEYRHECLALQESYQNQSLLAKQWQTKYQRASHNATDLAALIERHGLERAGNNVKNTNKRIVKKKKRRSVLAWLFGWNKDDNDDDQDELAGVYAQARSTLLQALQTERANVDELESALASLQQNNSAVAQQVQSRDLIINELNDRVAVFEEDKVVLKAALRQLRKEMSEEAPKTQALVNELKAAKKEIGKLQATLQKLTKAHKDELASINMALKAKDLTIQQAEANLTEIGMYVDRLEGRLADFAVARRDITAREKKCGDIEAAFNTSKQERGRLQQKVAELESEHADLKQLLQQMAEERTKLLSQTTSRNALQQEAAQLRQTLVNFETDYKSLENANADLLVRLDHLTKESSNLVESKQDLENRLSSTDSEFNALQHTIDSSLKEKQQLSLRLQYIESERLELQQTIQQLQLLLQNGERQQESKAESDAELQEKIASLEASNNRLQDFVHQLEARRQDLELSNEQLEALLEKRVHMDSSEASQLASSLPLLPSRVGFVSIADYEEFKTDPVVHMSLMELAPTVQSISHKKPSLNDKSLAGVKPVLVVPLEPLGGRFRKSNATKATQVANKTRTRNNPHRKVFLRQLRKGLAKTTGIHGLITKPSHFPSTQRNAPIAQQYGEDRKVSPSQITKLPIRAEASKEVSLFPPKLPLKSPTELYTKSTLASVNATLPLTSAGNASTFSTRNVNASSSAQRKVPLRSLRKFFSKATGVHGLLSTPSNPKPKTPPSKQPNVTSNMNGLSFGRNPINSQSNKNVASQPLMNRSPLPFQRRPPPIRPADTHPQLKGRMSNNNAPRTGESAFEKLAALERGSASQKVLPRGNPSEQDVRDGLKHAYQQPKSTVLPRPNPLGRPSRTADLIPNPFTSSNK